jgi:hypothetical protein
MEKVADYGLNEHVALIMKMENSDLLKNDFTEKQTNNMSRYFVSLPSEAAMKLWGVIGVNRPNTIKLHKCVVDGKPVKDFIVSLLAQQTKSE